MSRHTEKTPLRIVARFTDPKQADVAMDAISCILNDAKREVDALFQRQGGVAEVSDVKRVYARYGLMNECGWEQLRPLRCREDELFWYLPEGMAAEEAEGLLAAFGALSISVENPFDDELLKQVPHPAALILSETEDDFKDFEDFETLSTALYEKKILH